MKMKVCLKYVCLLLAAAAVILQFSAQAAGIDLQSYAVSSLTEVFGFTREEAAQFVFGEENGSGIAFWHPEHPDWIYTLRVDAITGRILETSPFDTGYTRFCGENTVRALMREIREKGLFAAWSPENHRALLELLNREGIRISTELCFGESAGSAAHGFFESCWGPEFGWPEPLLQLYRGFLDEYRLFGEPEPFHCPGVRQCAVPQPDGSVRTMTFFEGEIPEALAPALSDPHLEGWRCHGGAAVFSEGPNADGGTGAGDTGAGLAAFEKDGHRLLIQLTRTDGQWRIDPLGENALYRQGDYRVVYDGIHASFAVEYPLSADERSAFYLFPYGDEKTARCTIMACERLNEASGEAVWISVASGMPTWNCELDHWTCPKAKFPQQLGLVPMELFPVTAEAARQADYPGLPEGYAVTMGVNFRARTSSRSQSLGELKPGVVIPVLDILPGDPNEWIHTRLGSLGGYVVISYTSLGTPDPGLAVPQPVARAQGEITVRRGTGWFDGSVGTFPAGTKMHVVFETGDWLYVDIPGGEMTWLMDPEGTFGYVRKNDVVQDFMECRLDWLDE